MIGDPDRFADLRTFRLVQLGCAKNQVDGEVMAGLLEGAGLVPARAPEEADLIVVNTCGFVEAAREESVAAILDEAERKERGRCRLLVVAGCLAQRSADELAREIPEVDLFLGTGEFPRIVQALRDGQAVRPRVLVAQPTYLYDADTPRARAGPSAFLKIAEGCDNRCGYCAIGDLRGAFRSRRPEDVVREAARLAEAGVRELCLVSQDTTRYGQDLSPPAGLVPLVQEVLAAAPGAWVRLHYLHPARVDDGLLDLMAQEERLCAYLDIPIQHASDRVLSLMRRPTRRADLERLVARIRARCPGAAIRTSLIVGHPGEGEAEFRELLDFLRAARFDHVGVFCYSREEGTPSAALTDQVPPEVARERRHVLMEAQAVISEERNRARIGMTLPVLIERASVDYPGHHEGRTQFQAPEVDGITLVSDADTREGEIVRVRIEDATCYDLGGAVV